MTRASVPNRMVTVEELDRAITAGKAELTRPNVRPVRCAVCHRLCGVGQARRLWIDGHKRGFVCQSCQWDQAARCLVIAQSCIEYQPTGLTENRDGTVSDFCKQCGQPKGYHRGQEKEGSEPCTR